ncbi:MAG: GAF domain-containing protein, partial [Chloroflexi bacterium]|nr:GAF domain-containing protein [Chloroflexota bacterium]
FYYVIFLAYDPVKQDLGPAAYSGQGTMPPKHLRLPLDLGLTGRAAQERQPIIANDVTQDPHYVQGGVPGVQSEGAFPVQRAERLFGVLSITSQETHAFDDEAVRTLTALANQVAVALENAQLFVSSQQRVQELGLLTEISTALNQTLTLEETLNRVLQVLVDMLGEIQCFIALIDEPTDTLRIVAARHMTADRVHEFNQRAVPRDAGSFGMAIQTNTVVEVADTHADARVQAGLLHPSDELPNQATSIPLRTGIGQIIGVLTLGTLLGDENTRRLVLALADLSAVAIQRARQFDTEQRRRQEATTLRDVSAAITASLDLPTILNAIYEVTAPTLNADTFYVALYHPEQQELSFDFIVDAGAPMDSFRYSVEQGTGLAAWVIQHRQPLLLHDVQRDAPVDPVQMGEVVRSSVLVPIQRQDRLIGVIAAQSQQANTFDERDQWLLSAVADQAATAIHNAQLFDQIRQAEAQLNRQVQTLTTLLRVARDLQAPGDLQPKLDLIAQGIVDANLWRRAVITVFDQHWQATAMGAAGLTPAELERLDTLPSKNREQRELFYQERFRVSVSYYIPHDADLTPEDSIQSQRSAQEFIDWHPRDRLLVPLYGERGRVIGQLSVDDPVDGRRPSVESLQPLELFANQAAMAVESYRLFAEMRVMNQDLEAMLDSQRDLLAVVQELSSPVMPVFEGVLVMPLVGGIDAARAHLITRTLLNAIERERAHVIIVDITGVPVMDSHVARYLAEAMQATRMVGAEPVLVGITPAVAQTVVEIRADLGDVTTRSDLQSGVAYALRRLNRKKPGRFPTMSTQQEDQP